MKYYVQTNFSGTIGKTIEADSVEEAEELAKEWWDDLDAMSIVDHTTLDEIDVDEAE